MATSGVAPRMVLGLAIMCFGALLTLKQMGLIAVHDLGRFWPVVVIAFGLGRVLESRHRVTGYAWALFGLLLLLHSFRLFDFWHFFWPLVLLSLGAWVLRSGGRSCPSPTAEGVLRIPQSTDDRRISGFATLGGVSRRSSSPDFRGGDLLAVMGGLEVDLREASISSGEAVIETFAFWGGIELRVPADWQVVSQGVTFLGGFQDHTRNGGDGSKRLIIRGMTIMGGVEIKN